MIRYNIILCVDLHLIFYILYLISNIYSKDSAWELAVCYACKSSDNQCALLGRGVLVVIWAILVLTPSCCSQLVCPL